ncbi:hypothetical protein ABLN64_05235 [Mycobacterium tuberculosis]
MTGNWLGAPATSLFSGPRPLTAGCESSAPARPKSQDRLYEDHIIVDRLGCIVVQTRQLHDGARPVAWIAEPPVQMLFGMARISAFIGAHR